jgi:hypothetical protein
LQEDFAGESANTTAAWRASDATPAKVAELWVLRRLRVVGAARLSVREIGGA